MLSGGNRGEMLWELEANLSSVKVDTSMLHLPGHAFLFNWWLPAAPECVLPGVLVPYPLMPFSHTTDGVSFLSAHHPPYLL